MTDPVTGAIAKVAVSKAAELGKAVYDKANNARSSVNASKAIEALQAEHAAEQQRRLEGAAIAEEITAVHLELLERHRWDGEPEEEHATWDDVASASVDLVRQARRAGSNRKREVLFRAFYMQFDPEFYKTGMGRLLWGIACDLEYPTMWALREIEEKDEKDQAASVLFTSEIWGHVGRLEAHGLVYKIEGGGGLARTSSASRGKKVGVTHLGQAFIRFALDEYRERGDSEG